MREALLSAGELLTRNRQLILLDKSAELPYDPDTLLAPRFVCGGQAVLEDIGIF